MNRIAAIAMLLFTIAFAACRKGGYTGDPAARLQYSADTLHFDTVFVTAGSTSQVFKIINRNDQGIRIESIRLAGGINSAFRINADGVPGPQVTGINLEAGDSTYVFVTVTVAPGIDPLPFVIRDSIAISYNMHTDYVRLEAYGQNAHFFRNRVLKTSETWNNDLPYVILGGLMVDTTATLTINKGVRVYMHADAPLLVNGTLIVQGDSSSNDRVLFTGDRLDPPYSNYPAAYPGIIFLPPSRNNRMQYALVKNAYQGIIASGPATTGTQLTLQETIIDNAYDAGLIGINTSISARNLLVSNSGQNIVLAKGGNYDFTHCTLTGYSNSYVQHRDPVLTVANYLQEATGITVQPLSAVFRNCIFWGEANGVVQDEVVLGKQGNAAYSVVFDGVLWRVRTAPTLATGISGAINNQDPRFDTVNNNKRVYSFRLAAGSPALDKGVATPVTLDLDGRSRPVGLPDLGAYERR
jgi:hypothetical protein